MSAKPNQEQVRPVQTEGASKSAAPRRSVGRPATGQELVHAPSQLRGWLVAGPDIDVNYYRSTCSNA